MLLSRETRILIVDDDEDDFILTKDYIAEIDAPQISIDWAPGYADAIEHVKTGKYDVYLVDYHMGAKNGLDFLKEAIRLNCEEPIILLTGKGNPKVDKEAMIAGAADYLIKSELNPEKLERSIRYSLEHTASLKALRASEGKYRNMFERSKDSVFIADLELVLKDVNKATSELLQRPIHEIVGMSLFDVLGPSKTEVMAKFSHSREINDLEIKFINNNGEKKSCLISTSIQKGMDNTSYIQGIVHDISSLKKAEKATLQAEKLAATSRLVSAVAHEVRNPLNNIQMATEQLVVEIGNEGDNDLFFKIIQGNCKRINDLINELLNTSRPTEMKLQRVSIQKILEESIGATQDRITLQGIKLNAALPEVPFMIMGDADKLKIAFSNIIINAIEAMSPGDGELQISIDEKTPYYLIEISDNGCGIPTENISKLFEPYFTSKRNGMGLGLASTLNILQAHKASIDVASREGTGTTFAISFLGQ